MHFENSGKMFASKKFWEKTVLWIFTLYFLSLFIDDFAIIAEYGPIFYTSYFNYFVPGPEISDTGNMAVIAVHSVAFIVSLVFAMKD